MRRIFITFLTLFFIQISANSFDMSGYDRVYSGLFQYRNNAQNKVDNNWNPPASDNDYEIVLLYTIDENGIPKFDKILNSSGDSIADEAAMQAVLNASPFESPKSSMLPSNVKIEFAFNYKALSPEYKLAYVQKVQKERERKIKEEAVVQNEFVVDNAYKFRNINQKTNSFVLENAIIAKKKLPAKSGTTALVKKYTEEVSKKIQNNWHPSRVRDFSKIVVKFVINQKGYVTEYKMVSSSSDPDANAAAIKAIYDSSPFLSPENAGIIGKPVTVEFEFDYNIISKN